MDGLLRGINRGHNTRVVGAVTTELVREACRRHQLRGTAAQMLGQALTAGCLLTTLTKNERERVRIEVRGGGAVRQLLVDAHANGDVRGTLTQTRESSHSKAGKIVVTRDLGLEQPYQGVVAREAERLDEDLERYLCESEQLPSVLACEVQLDASGGVRQAAGLLCQTFPGAPEAVLEPLRAFVRDGGFADLLRKQRTLDDIVGFALLGEAHQAIEPRSLRFHCPCGRARALAVVSTLGADDIEALAQEQDHTTVTCSYCGDDYTLGSADLRKLAAQMRAEQS